MIKSFFDGLGYAKDPNRIILEKDFKVELKDDKIMFLDPDGKIIELLNGKNHIEVVSPKHLSVILDLVKKTYKLEVSCLKSTSIGEKENYACYKLKP